MKRILHTPLAGLLIGAAITAAQHADAQTYNYIQTSAGAAGDWTNPSNWSPNTGYPGNTAGVTNNANVAQTAGGSYAVTLGQTLPGVISRLDIANTAGTATVEIQAPLNVSGGTYMGQNGWLVIDGAPVTGGGLGFGPGSGLVLDNGGVRAVGNSTQYVGENMSGATGLVTSARGAPGTLVYQGNVLRVGNNTANGGNCLRIENGVVVTNINLQVNWQGTNNVVVVDNASVYANNHLQVGENGGRDGLLLVDNGGRVQTGGPLVTGGALSMGATSSGNRVVVKNGSHLQTRGVGYIRGTNNWVIVSGEGSSIDMSRSALRVGSGARPHGSGLRVEAGAVVTNMVGAYFVDGAAGFNIRLEVDNAKLYGENVFLFGCGRDCVFELTGRDALMQGTSAAGTAIQLGQCSNGNLYYWSGSTNNVMRVDGGTVRDFGFAIGGLVAGAVSNRLEVTNGGRVVVPPVAAGSIRFGVCEAASNSWGNAAIFTKGSVLETKQINLNGTAHNGASPGPVWDNFISFEDSALLFNMQQTTINIASNGVISLKNSAVGYHGIMDAYLRHGNFARLAFIGDNAFRLSNAALSTVYNQEYAFEKNGDPSHFYRLEMVDGETWYRSNNNALHTLSFGASGEMWCSNTTATVSLATTVDGKLTVLDSAVLFERGLALNGDLRIHTGALAKGPNIITVDGDLTLGAGSRVFIDGASRDDVTIQYTGALYGRFAEKHFSAANYSVSYGTGNDGFITFRYAPPGTMLLVK